MCASQSIKSSPRYQERLKQLVAEEVGAKKSGGSAKAKSAKGDKADEAKKAAEAKLDEEARRHAPAHPRTPPAHPRTPRARTRTARVTRVVRVVHRCRRLYFVDRRVLVFKFAFVAVGALLAFVVVPASGRPCRELLLAFPVRAALTARAALALWVRLIGSCLRPRPGSRF